MKRRPPVFAAGGRLFCNPAAGAGIIKPGERVKRLERNRDHMKQTEGTVQGIYQATGRGFGFLSPEAGTKREDDYFIPPRSEGGAWHGDTVLALPARGEAGPEERRTAAVTAVLERANKTVTGTIRKHSREICSSMVTEAGSIMWRSILETDRWYMQVPLVPESKSPVHTTVIR